MPGSSAGAPPTTGQPRASTITWPKRTHRTGPAPAAGGMASGAARLEVALAPYLRGEQRRAEHSAATLVGVRLPVKGARRGVSDSIHLDALSGAVVGSRRAMTDELDQASGLIQRGYGLLLEARSTRQRLEAMLPADSASGGRTAALPRHGLGLREWARADNGGGARHDEADAGGGGGEVVEEATGGPERMTNQDEVRDTFQVLVERSINGLNRIMAIEDEPLHYIAALVIAAGCEAACRILKSADLLALPPGRKWTPQYLFIEEIVVTHPPLDRDMGDDLFRVLRHGIAHLFEPKFIKLSDETQIELIVSRRERPHFGRRPDPPGIYLNLETMRDDFIQMLKKYRAMCEASSRPGRGLGKEWHEVEMIWEVRKKPSETSWRAFMDGRFA